ESCLVLGRLEQNAGVPDGFFDDSCCCRNPALVDRLKERVYFRARSVSLPAFFKDAACPSVVFLFENSLLLIDGSIDHACALSLASCSLQELGQRRVPEVGWGLGSK